MGYGFHNVGDNPGLYTALVNTLSKTLDVGYTLTFIGLVLTVGAQIAEAMVLNDRLKINFFPIIRAFVMLIIILEYQWTLDLISSGLEALYKHIRPDEVKGVLAYFQKLVTDTQPNTADSNMYNPLNALNWVSSWGMNMMTIFSESIIIFVVRVAVEKLRLVLLVFLVVTGPIAYGMSTIPGFQGLAAKWFAGYLHVQCWNITLAVLDMIFMNFDWAIFGIGVGLESASNMTINLIIVLCYFIVPYLTTLYLGRAAASAFSGKILDTAAKIAGGAARMASKGGAASSSKASSAASSSKGTAASASSSSSQGSLSGGSSPQVYRTPRRSASPRPVTVSASVVRSSPRQVPQQSSSRSLPAARQKALPNPSR